MGRNSDFIPIYGYIIKYFRKDHRFVLKHNSMVNYSTNNKEVQKMKQVNYLLTFLFLFSLICQSWQVKAQSSGKNLNEETVVLQNYVGHADIINKFQTP